jgi:integrase
MDCKKKGGLAKMKGLFKRGNVWWYRYSSNGKQIQKTTEQTDEARAIERAREIQESQIQEIIEQPIGLTIAEATKRFLITIKQQGRSRRYIEYVESALSLFQRETDIRLISDVTSARVQEWFDRKAKHVKIETAASYLKVIKRVFNYTIKTGRSIRKNPFDEIAIPKYKSAMRETWIDRDGMETLINNCLDLELKYILYCGFHAGLRKDEVIMSQPGWFDLRAKTLRVKEDPITGWKPKDRDRRTIPLTDEFIAFLEKEYPLRGPYMVASNVEQGVARYRFDFKKRFDRFKGKHGFADYTFHDLRRSFASQRASAGVGLYFIAKWLGDDEATTQKHYGHLQAYLAEINLPPRPGEKNVIPIALSRSA